MEALNDSQDQAVVQAFDPMRIHLMDLHHMGRCPNPDCPNPGESTVSTDLYTTLHLDVPTPTAVTNLAQVVNEYLTNGYETEGNIHFQSIASFTITK